MTKTYLSNFMSLLTHDLRDKNACSLSLCSHAADAPCPHRKVASTVVAVIASNMQTCGTRFSSQAMAFKCLEIYDDFVTELKPCPDVKVMTSAFVLDIISNSLSQFLEDNNEIPQ